MNAYDVVIDGGDGGRTTIQAATLAAAVKAAREWAAAGEWREDGVVSVWVSGPDGETVVSVPVAKSDVFA